MDTPSFGLLCARAVFTARQSAHDLNQKFTLKDAAAIIDQLDECRSPEELPSSKPQPAPSSGKRFTPTDLIPAMAMACNYNPAELTPPMRSTIKTVVLDILSVSPNVSPEEIRSRADAYRRKHKDWALTPPMIAKYWSELGESNGLTFIAKQEIAPKGWEEAFRIYRKEQEDEDPVTTEYMISLGWERLGSGLRQAVKKRMGL
jgi:hypothetical protein